MAGFQLSINGRFWVSTEAFGASRSWTWDPDPHDETFEVALALLLHEPAGAIRSDSDRHRCGLFPRAAWLAWIEEAGFAPSVRMDRWGRDVFTGKKTRRRA
jgi:hypothetical protein